MRSTEREDDEHYRSASSAHAGRCYLARQGREIKRLDRRESNRCTIPYYHQILPSRLPSTSRPGAVRGARDFSLGIHGQFRSLLDRINGVATIRCHPRSALIGKRGSPQRRNRPPGYQCASVLGSRSFQHPSLRALASRGVLPLMS
jgi:hypothetical protein